MQEKPKILIDLDGTLCNTPTATRNFLYYKKQVKVFDVNFPYKYYDLRQNYPTITKEIIDNMFYSIDFWKTVRLYPFVNLLLRKLSEKYEIHICTARIFGDEVTSHTKNLFDFCKIPYHEFKFLTHSEKIEYVKKESIKFVLEDHPNSTDFVEANDCLVALIKWDYNKHIHGNYNIIPCADYNDVINLLYHNDPFKPFNKRIYYKQFDFKISMFKMHRKNRTYKFGKKVYVKSGYLR